MSIVNIAENKQSAIEKNKIKMTEKQSQENNKVKKKKKGSPEPWC